jgi:hypothetical protein
VNKDRRIVLIDDDLKGMSGLGWLEWSTLLFSFARFQVNDFDIL